MSRSPERYHTTTGRGSLPLGSPELWYGSEEGSRHVPTSNYTSPFPKDAGQ